MIRSAHAAIDLQALTHNLARAKIAASNSQALAVVKADAYGHGLITVAETLSDQAEGMAVACLPEAQVLRKAGYQGRIVLLHGVKNAQEQEAAAEFGLDLVLHEPYQIELLQGMKRHGPLDIWLKLDTGMHRLGFPPSRATALFQKLTAMPVVGVLRFMTHFADADDRQSHYTQGQMDIFNQATRGLEGEQSCANSAAILGHPQTHRDWIRPGIMLYGASPFVSGNAEMDGLKPVMHLSAPLIAIQALKKGDTIGYGRTWTCPEDMNIGVVAIGYGDGYPRHATNGTPVMINGVMTQVVGRVSMDLVTIDLRSIGAVEIGMPVQLWGDRVSADEVANYSGTIAYELFCSVGERVRREYVKS